MFSSATYPPYRSFLTGETMRMPSKLEEKLKEAGFNQCPDKVLGGTIRFAEPTLDLIATITGIETNPTDDETLKFHLSINVFNGDRVECLTFNSTRKRWTLHTNDGKGSPDSHKQHTFQHDPIRY